MMSKERDSLEKRLAEYNNDTSCMTFAAHRHLKEQLAQLPREPLSDEDAHVLCQNRTLIGGTLLDLLRDVEKAHGIRGGE